MANSQNLFFATLSSHHEDNSRLIDSDATHHMISTEELLNDTTPTRAQAVTFGDDITYDVAKIGKAPIALKNSNIHHHISNVLYVASMEQNLLSVS